MRSNRVKALAPNPTKSLEYLLCMEMFPSLSFYKSLPLHLLPRQISSVEIVYFLEPSTGNTSYVIQQFTTVHCGI